MVLVARIRVQDGLRHWRRLFVEAAFSIPQQQHDRQLQQHDRQLHVHLAFCLSINVVRL